MKPTPEVIYERVSCARCGHRTHLWIKEGQDFVCWACAKPAAPEPPIETLDDIARAMADDHPVTRRRQR